MWAEGWGQAYSGGTGRINNVTGGDWRSILPVTLIYDQWKRGTWLIRGKGQRGASIASPFTVTDWGSMKSGTSADWGSGESVAKEGSCVWEDLVGCVETGLSEPSKAADTVIKAVLKGAFHWLIGAAGAALFALSLSKEQPCTHTKTHSQMLPKAAQEGLCYFSAILPHNNLICYSRQHPTSQLPCFLTVLGILKQYHCFFSSWTKQIKVALLDNMC